MILEKFSQMAMPDQDTNEWQKIKKLWDSRDNISNIVKMEKYLNIILKNDPDDFDAWMWLGRIFHFQAMYVSSEKKREFFFSSAALSFSQAKRIDPSSKNALYWWAICEQTVGDYEFVLREVKEKLTVFKAEPVLPVLSDKYSYGKKAMDYWAKREDIDQANKAAKIFENIANNNPKETLCWLWLSRVQMYRGLYEFESNKKFQIFDLGYRAAKKAVSMSFRDPKVHYFLALNLGLSVENSLVKQLSASKEIINSLRILASEDADYKCGGITYYQAFGIARAGMFSKKIMNMLGIKEELVLKTALIFSHIYPNCFEGKLACAELAYSIGKKDMAINLFNEILNASPYEDPVEFGPENVICVRDAKRFIKQNGLDIS